MFPNCKKFKLEKLHTDIHINDGHSHFLAFIAFFWFNSLYLLSAVSYDLKTAPARHFGSAIPNQDVSLSAEVSKDFFTPPNGVSN